jgi:hypothetical protein
LAFGIFLLVYGPILLGAKRTSQGPQLLSLKTAKALDLSVLQSLIATSTCPLGMHITLPHEHE